MNTKVIVGFVSSILFLFGNFLPLFRNPITGTTNYFMYSDLEGLLVLLCSIYTIILVSIKKYTHLVYPGLIASIILLLFYISIQSRFARASYLLRDAPQVLNQFSGLLYGFYIMFISAITLTVIGFQSKRSKKNETN